MTRTIFFSVIFLFSLLNTSAQINGRVANITGEAISYCNVILRSLKDSSLVTGSTTDTAGYFSLEIKDTGSVFIEAAFVGYRKYLSSQIYITSKSQIIAHGTITMINDATMLKNVEVVAQKSFMEHKVDRTVYNIQNSIITAGNNGLDVLKKLPGVTVSSKEDIEVRGKSGALVLIDGRTSYMSSADLANYLKSLDASQIDKIEVITNPSAKYDASGNAVINIVLFKDKNLGLNGRVSSTGALGFYYGTNVGLSLNYRTKKLNYFFNGYQWKFKRYDASYQQNIFSRNEVKYGVFNDTTWNVYEGEGSSLRGGIDYFINTKHTIGIVGELYRNEGINTLSDKSSFYDGYYTLDSTLYTSADKELGNLEYNLDLNYQYKISKNKELALNADYGSFKTHSTETDITTFNNTHGITPQQNRVLFYKLPRAINVYAANLDYEQVVFKDVKIETGLKASLVHADNTADYWNVVNGINVPDSGKTNHFIYSEYIYAAYINLSKTVNKVDVQLGVRAEDTESKGDQISTDSVFTRSYLKFFPSCFVNWRADSSNTFNVSYSRRIDRPDYGMLNPFKFYRNPYSYGTGNPYLRPMISNNFILEHVFKSKLTTGIGFLHMEDVISAVVHQSDSSNVIYTTDENVNKYDSYSVNVAFNLAPTNWYRFSTSINGFYDHYYGPTKEGFYSNSGYTYIIHMMNTFSLKKEWVAEVALFYRSRNIAGYVVNDPIYNLSAGISKGFGKGKGNIRLNCDDILWSDRLVNKMNFKDMNYRGTFFSDSRRIRLSLSWKFGTSQYERQERNKSAQEERNRISK
jgi:hypothetical protein